MSPYRWLNLGKVLILQEVQDGIWKNVFYIPKL